MIFDKFKGISKEREIDVSQPDRSGLHGLMLARDKCVDFLGDVSQEMLDAAVHDDFTVLKNAYSALEKKFMNNIAFTKNDLQDFILTNANADNDDFYSEALGLYTGFLLHLLTKRNNGLRFCISGGGSKFDYLFFAAHTIDELIVSDFIGKNICSDIGCMRGKASLIALSNIKGERVAEKIGYFGGKIGRVVCTDIMSYRALGQLGEEGHINQVIAVRVKGDHMLDGCAEDGRINQIVGVCLEGENILYEAGGKLGDGRIGQVICAGVKGKNSFNWLGNESDVIQLLYDDVQSVGEYIGAQNVSCGGKIITASAHSFNPDKIARALDFARELGGKTCQEIIGLADKMYKFRPQGNELK